MLKKELQQELGMPAVTVINEILTVDGAPQTVVKGKELSNEDEQLIRLCWPLINSGASVAEAVRQAKAYQANQLQNEAEQTTDEYEILLEEIQQQAEAVAEDNKARQEQFRIQTQAERARRTAEFNEAVYYSLTALMSNSEAVQNSPLVAKARDFYYSQQVQVVSTRGLAKEVNNVVGKYLTSPQKSAPSLNSAPSSLNSLPASKSPSSQSTKSAWENDNQEE